MAPSQKDNPLISHPLVSLLPALQALSSLLKQAQVKGMVIGGIAAALLGKARATVDIDATILADEEVLNQFVEQAAQLGLTPRRNNPLAFARRTRMLLLKHESSGVQVDIALGSLPFEREAIRRAVQTDLGDLVLPLPKPEDLVIMKAVAHRPRDLEDIRGIVSVHPKLDVRYIRKEVQEFAKAMEMPELWTDISPLFPSTKRPGRFARSKKLKK